jgi:hypothetical protein
VDTSPQAITEYVWDSLKSSFLFETVGATELKLEGGKLHDSVTGLPFQSFYSESFFVHKNNGVEDLVEPVNKLVDSIRERFPSGSTLRKLASPLVFFIAEEEDKRLIRLWVDCVPSPSQPA